MYESCRKLDVYNTLSVALNKIVISTIVISWFHCETISSAMLR